MLKPRPFYCMLTWFANRKEVDELEHLVSSLKTQLQNLNHVQKTLK